MEFMYNPKTKSKISKEEFEKLSPDEQKDFRPWKDRKPGDDKNGGQGKPGYEKQDYAWWEVSETISKAVGNIAFNRFAGNKETVGFSATKVEGTEPSTVTVSAEDSSIHATPGVLSIKYIPTPGMSNSGVSALNMAARSIYTWVRHQNSGRSNYEANDLMIYLEAMDQIYTLYFEAMRVYKAALTWTYDNRYIPKMVFVALGVNLDDVTTNLANFRYYLNLVSSKIGSLCVPKKFKLYERRYLLAKNIFTDSDSLRGQFYMFRTTGYLKYSATADVNGGCLQYTKHSVHGPHNTRLAIDIVNDLNNALEAVLQDEDMNIMSGDILKAYGRENLYTLPEVAETDPLDIIYNEDVLAQIENAFSFHNIPFESDVLEDTVQYLIKQQLADGDRQSWLETSFSVPTPGSYQVLVDVQKAYFNSHKDSPDYKDVIEWTRLHCNGSYCTELVLGFELCTNVYDSATDLYTVNSTSFTSMRSVASPATPANVAAETVFMTNLQKFDWHPAVYYVQSEASGSGNARTIKYVGVGIDLKVYSLLDKEDAQRLNDACSMGVLGKLTMSV